RTARTLNEAASPLAGFQTLFDELTAGIGSEAGARGCFMVNSVAELVPYDQAVTAIAMAYSDALQQLFGEALTRAAASGPSLRKERLDELAAYLFNAMQGIRILIKSGTSRERVQE